MNFEKRVYLYALIFFSHNFSPCYCSDGEQKQGVTSIKPGLQRSLPQSMKISSERLEECADSAPSRGKERIRVVHQRTPPQPPRHDEGDGIPLIHSSASQDQEKTRGEERIRVVRQRTNPPPSHHDEGDGIPLTHSSVAVPDKKKARDEAGKCVKEGWEEKAKKITEWMDRQEAMENRYGRTDNGWF